jgi:pimeloyl-ACP methyl ester carboxylesterase
VTDSRFEFIATGDKTAPSNDAILDVILLHGLSGDCFATWTHDNGEFWPQWLAEDYPLINVYSAGYDSQFTAKLLKGGGAGLIDIATMVLDRLMSRKTKSKPIVFVTHSLGGLVVKQLLRRSSESSNSKRKRVCGNTLGVVFIGTPHQGAQFAPSLQKLFSMALSQQVRDVAYASAPLVDLSHWFSNWAPNANLLVWAYYEIDQYNGKLVVDQVTANPNVLGCDPVALQSNHVEMVKLSQRDTQLYRSLGSAIDEVIGSLREQSASGQPEQSFHQELAAYTMPAEADRRNLAEKLTAAGRVDEIPRAERQKERFSMDVQRSIVQPAAVRRYTRLLSNIETRFQRHVAPAITVGESRAAIDRLVQDLVLDPSLSADDADGGCGTQSYVESAYYYLAGNCHIGWDEDE